MESESYFSLTGERQDHLGISLWIVDEVTQLLSTKNLKEIVGKNELVRNKLLEELNSLFLFSWKSWCFYGLQPKFFFLSRIFRPFFYSKLGYL